MGAIKLYKAGSTSFDNNGLGVLTRFVNDIVAEERNGEFYLELDIYDSDPLFSLIETDMILKCDASKDSKDQRFRIAVITKTKEGNHHLYCEHESYSTQRLGIKPNVVLSNVNGQKALELWKSSLLGDDVYTVHSDVTTETSTTWDISEVTNARLALGGVEGSILDKWGGEYRFDNNRINLLTARGKESGAVIAYGKNLIDLTQEKSIQNVYTCIYPFAKVVVDEVETIYTVNGYIVESEYANNYFHKRILTVDFSTEFDSDNLPTSEKLKELAETYAKNNKIGIPKVSLDVSFVDLKDTKDYEDLSWYEEIYLCDTVTVYFEKLGINVKAKVIKTMYSPSLGRYTEISIGEPKYTLGDKLNSISTTANALANQAQTTANFALTSANGKNTNYYGTAKPNNPKVGDLWYKTNGEYTELWQYTSDGWILIVDDLNGIKLEEEMKENAKLTQDAVKAGEDAKTAGEEAKAAGQVATDLANQSIADSSTALAKADSAVAQANNAIQTSNLVKVTADNALTQSNTAISNASSAITQAKEALDAYNNLEIGGRNYLLNSVFSNGKTNWEATNSTANTILSGSDIPGTPPSGVINCLKNVGAYAMQAVTLELNTQYTFSGWFYVPSSVANARLTARYGSSYTTIANLIVTERDMWVYKTLTFITNASNAITRVGFGYELLDSPTTYMALVKLEKGNIATDHSLAPEDVQIQIDTINGELSLKVSQTTFNTLQNTVNSQATQITANTNAIALKANQTDVNTLSGKVSVVESSLTVQAGQITAVNSLVNNHTTQISTLTSNYNSLSSTIATVRNDLDSLSVGGRNYFSIQGAYVYPGYTSSVIDKANYKMTLTMLDVANKYIVFRSTNSFTPIVGQTYTYSGKITVNGEPMADGYLKGNVFNTYNGSQSGKITVYEDGTFVGTNTLTVSDAGQWILHMPTSAKAGDIIVIEKFKIEKGNVATDWSPAPEDLTTVVEFSNFQQTVNGFQVTVNSSLANHESKITLLSNSLNSTITSLNNLSIGGSNLLLGTKDWSKGKIRGTILDEKYMNYSVLYYDNSSGTSHADVARWDNAIDVKQDTEYTLSFYIKGSGQGMYSYFYPSNVASGYTSRGSMITGADGACIFPLTDEWTKYWIVWKTKSDTTGLKNVMPMRLLAGSIGYICGVKFEYGNKATDWSLAPEETATQSQIAQLSTDINLRVEKNDVINQINVSTEGILISGAKTHITGLTTIDNAVIKTAHLVDASITNAKIANLAVSTAKIADAAITNAKIGALAVGTANIANAAITDAKISSLSATKITTGTLNASNVAVINLNASNITTGYLSASRIAASSITADKLATNAIMVGFNAIGTTLQLSSTALSFYSSGVLEGKLTSEGMEFWYGTRKIGRMGEIQKAGDANIRGIQMGLDYQGDFVSWGYKTNSTTSTYTAMLTLDPKGSFTGTAGIHAAQDIFLNTGKTLRLRYIGTNGYNPEGTLELTRVTVSGYNGTLLSNTIKTSGIWFGDDGRLKLYSRGGIYDMHDWLFGK